MFFPESRIRVFLYGQPADMRKSYDGLYALARQSFDTVSGNPPEFLLYEPDPCKSERSGLSANSSFHRLGVNSATRAAGCWPTRCSTSMR